MNNLENLSQRSQSWKNTGLISNTDMNFKSRLNQSMMIESRIAVILGEKGVVRWGLALTRMEHKEIWILESSISGLGSGYAEVYFS